MSASAPNSAKKPFKPPSFNAPTKARSSLSLNQGSASEDDTPSSKSVPSSNSSHTSRKTLGVAATSSTKVKKGSSHRNKKEDEQISKTVHDKEDTSKGAIRKKKPAASSSSSKKIQNKNSAFSATNKTASLPSKLVKTSEQSGSDKTKKELFPDSSESKSSSDTHLNSGSSQVISHSSLKDQSAVSKSHSLDSDSSCPSSKNSSRSVTPIRELVNSVPWGIHVTPQRGAALEEFKKKLASISGSTTSTGSMKNTPTFSDNSNPIADCESGHSLKEESIVKDSSQHSDSSTKRTANSAPVTYDEMKSSPSNLAQRSSNSAPIITEVKAKDEAILSDGKKSSHADLENLSDAKFEFKHSFEVGTVGDALVSFGNQDSSASSQKEQLPNRSGLESNLRTDDGANNLVTSTENVEKDLTGIEDFLQETFPKQLYSHDMFDSQTLLGASDFITLVPSSIGENSSHAAPVQTSCNGKSNLTVGTSSAYISAEESSEKSKPISKPLFKRPTNPKSVRTNKDKKVSNNSEKKEPSKMPADNKMKSDRTQQIKRKKDGDSNPKNRKLQKKIEKPSKENNSLPMKEKTCPKLDNTESGPKSPVKESTAKRKNLVRKSTDDCQASKKLRSSTAKQVLEKSLQEMSKRRTARKIISSETTRNTSQKKGRKRAKEDNDVSSQIITLAISKAGKTGRVPKYVNSRKLTQRERLQALHKLRNVGVWIECCNSSCSKWRYVDEIKDPSQVPRLWYCKMNPDPDYNSCSKPEQVMSPDEEEDLIETSFTAGSVVWARVFGYPYWPAMVEDDPEIEQFYWLHDQDHQKVTHYHVTFFDTKGVTRAWVPTSSVRPFTEFESRSTKNLVGKHAAFSARINAAKAEAFNALQMENAERLAKYSFIVHYTGPIHKKKIGLCVSGGIYDSSNSEESSDSQNSADSDFFDKSSQYSPSKNENASGPNEETTSDDSGLTPSPNMNENVNPDTNPKKKSVRTELDCPLEESASSLHHDQSVIAPGKLESAKSDTSSHLSHDDLFNEVTSSQDIFAPQEIGRNVISPVMDNVDDLTADDVRNLSQEAPSGSNNPITSTIKRLSQTIFGAKE